MFVCIEWVDWSWKKTQTKLLLDYFKSQWKSCESMDFPRYWTWSAIFVEKYLNWEFGTFAQVNDEIASMFYALDRFGHKKELLNDISQNEYFVTDRYSISNFIHRGTKYLENKDEQWLHKFFDWLSDLEFNKVWLPKPDLIIFLSLSLNNLKILMEKKRKENRDLASLKDQNWLDLAESDFKHQELSLRIWQEILPKYFDNYKVIDCDSADWWILNIDEIHKKIIDTIQNFE